MATEMGTVREQRYRVLREYYHVLHREGLEWSKIDFEHPSAIYIKNMLVSIKQSYDMYIRSGGTAQGWTRSVVDAYQRNGYVTQQLKNGKLVATIDPWQRLRATEDAFKALDKKAEYSSPHLKKWQDFRETEKKLDKALGY